MKQWYWNNDGSDTNNGCRTDQITVRYSINAGTISNADEIKIKVSEAKKKRNKNAFNKINIDE